VVELACHSKPQADPTLEEERSDMTPPLPEPTETILVVDDEPEVLSMTAELLRRIGYTVLCTEDPREALRIARTTLGPLHLLLTDVVMPVMNGLELTERLRAIHPRIKVLFMSAYTTDVVEDYYGVQIAPGEPFLVKPFTTVDLSSKVRAVLNRLSPFSKPNRR
jgi:two-component system cell cycle sensor histidine kinase/response regulator CckA